MIRNNFIKLNKQDSEWLIDRIPYLTNKSSENPPVLFIIISVFLENPEKYLQECINLFKIHIINEHFLFHYELCHLFKISSAYIPEGELNFIVDLIFKIYETSSDKFEKQKMLAYLDAIPLPWRTKRIMDFVDSAKQEGFSPTRFTPAVASCMIEGGRDPSISFKVFLRLPQHQVLRALTHFKEIEYREDFYLREDSDIKYQLQKAISIAPSKFNYIWVQNWKDMDEHIRFAVLRGLTDHLSYISGQLQSDNYEVEEKSEPLEIVTVILSLIEETTNFEDRDITWSLKVCSNISFENEHLYKKIIKNLGKYVNYIDSNLEEKEDIDMGIALNSSIGTAIEAAIILFEKREGEKISPQHKQLLKEFSLIDYLSIKSFYIYRMRNFLYFDREFAWQLFNNLFTNTRLYSTAGVYNFLYYCYHQEFSLVLPHLDSMQTISNEETGVHWGHLIALCLLDEHITFETFEQKMRESSTAKSWKGALNVFILNLNYNANDEDNNTIEKCLNGIRFILNSKPDLDYEKIYFSEAFRSSEIQDSVIIELSKEILRKNPAICIRSDSFFSRMSRVVSTHANEILELMEIISKHSAKKDWEFFWGKEILSVVTELFKEGEYREISDSGDFLHRVLTVIDQLQKKNVDMDNWYDDFERA